MASNYPYSPSSKFSYLDGVHFAINPIFVDYESSEKSDESKKHSKKGAKSLELPTCFNYDFSKAESIIDYNYDFKAEATVLYQEQLKKAKHKQQLISDNEKKHQLLTKNTSNENLLNTDQSNTSKTTQAKDNKHVLSNSNEPTKQLAVDNPNLSLSSSLPTYSPLSTGDTVNNSTTKPAHATKLITVPNNVLANYSKTKLLEPTRTNGFNSSSSNSGSNGRLDEINNNNQSFNVDKNNVVKDLFNLDNALLDPFNDMELKTINEFEELKNILSNQVAPVPSSSQQASSSTSSSKVNFFIDQHSNQTESTLHISPATTSKSNTSNASIALDNFGLPKISFIDLDLNKS